MFLCSTLTKVQSCFFVTVGLHTLLLCIIVCRSAYKYIFRIVNEKAPALDPHITGLHNLHATEVRGTNFYSYVIGLHILFSIVSIDLQKQLCTTSSSFASYLYPTVRLHSLPHTALSSTIQRIPIADINNLNRNHPRPQPPS